MSLRFWKKPKYFDFERHRKPVVILHDFISAIVAALGLGSIFGAGTVIGVAAGGMVYGVSGSFLATLIVSGALMAVSSLVSGLSKPSDRSFQSGKELSNTMSVGDPIGVGYGCRRIGGTRVFVWSTTGVNLKDLHLVIGWGEGPMKGPKVDGAGEMIWLDDRRMQYYQTYKGLNLAYHEFHKGTHDQTVSAALQSYIPAWAEAMRFTAYSYFRFRYKAGAWGSLPNVTCVMEMCENVFDDRDGSHTYSRNPVLATRDFITHPRYGGGVEGSLVGSASQIICANWVDDVSHRYYFDGIIKERQPFADNVQAMLANFKGDVVWSGGTYKTIIHKWDAPVVPVDELSIEENPTGANALGIDTGSSEETPKRVKGYFADPTDNYNVKPVYWPQVAPDVAESDKISAEFSLIGTAGDPTDPAGTAYKQALRILKYQYLRQRFSKTFACNAHPSLYPLELGDIFSVSHNPLIQATSIPSSWTLKPLRVLKIGMNQDNKIALQVIEEDSSIYDETVQIVAHAAFTPVLPGFDDALDVPTNLTATTGEDESTPQKVDAYVLFGWDNVRFGSEYQHRWRKSTVAKWKTERIKDPSDATEWITLTAYALGAFVYPTSTHITGYFYEATVAGTSGAGEPTWPTTPGNTVVDGGVTWTCRAMNRIELRVPKLEPNVIIYWQVKTLGEKVDSEWGIPGSPITTWAPSTPGVTGVVLTVTGQEKFILLSWTDPTNYEYNVYKWQIYRGTTGVFGSAVLIKKDPGAKREYKDSQVSKGIIYYYWLKIENKNGLVSAEIGPSTGQLTDPETPGPPIFIPDVIPPTPNPPTGMASTLDYYWVKTITKVQANLSWNECTDEGGTVEYLSELWKIGETTKITKYPSKVNSVTVKNLDTDETYYWTVKAKDPQNNWTSACAIQTLTTSHDTSAPAVVDGASYMVQTIDGIKHQWIKNTEDDIDHYRLYVYTADTVGSSVVLARIKHPANKFTVKIGMESETGGIVIAYNTAYYFWITAVDRSGNESAKLQIYLTAAIKYALILKAAELLHYQKPWKLKNLQHIRKYIAEDTDDTYTVPDGKVALITRYNLVRGGAGGTGSYIAINDEIIDTAISAGSPILRNSKWTYGMYVEYGDHIDIHTGNSAGSTAEVRVDEFDADSDIVVQALFIDGATIYTVPASKHGLLVFAFDVEGSPSVQLLISIDGGANYYDLMAIGLEKFDATAGCMQLEAGYKLKSSSTVDLWITIIEIPN